MDDTAKQNFFDQMHRLWIEPEIQKRTAEGTLPPDFKIYRALMLLPKDRPPIVSFNDEIGWTAKAVPAEGKEFIPNQPAYLHDIDRIESVEPPTVDGKRVAFVFLYWAGHQYATVMDFSPNWPESSDESKEETWVLGTVIAEYLQDLLKEKTIRFYEQNHPQLAQIGLWAAPALLPYPISDITNRISQGDLTGARQLLVAHCTPRFLRTMMDEWWDTTPFSDRKKLLDDAYYSHTEGRYGVCIYALVPQVEGIVADWVSANLPTGTVMPFRQDSRMQRLSDIIANSKQLLYTDRKILDYLIGFVLQGPVLKVFAQWTDPIDPTFPSRHAVSHGRYDEAFLTEEYSIKLLLLLDTVHHVMNL